MARLNGEEIVQHISALPDIRAGRNPTGPCIADDREQLDNDAFLKRVRSAAGVLRVHGIGVGDVVAVALANRLELVVIMFAAWRLGAAVTPVNPGLTDTEARHQIEDSGAKVVITDSRGTGTLDVTAFAGAAVQAQDAVSPAPGAVLPALDSLALIIYTSGTTGRPKGVMLDHANIAAMCRMIVDGIGLDETDHSLLVLPLFHVNGIVVSVLSPLLAGGRATIAGRFRASSFFASVEAARPTYFSAVPTIYAMLVSLPDEVLPDTSSLRRAICGAAPMPAELIARFENRFGVPVVEGYGLSEGTCASTLNPPAGPRKPGTVGLPLPGQTVAVMDAEGHLLDAGSVGEVVVRGPNVMRGYLGLPDETSRTVVDGWLHTGDVGRFDTDGHLVLVDRIKDMIIRGGENIYPKEIESVLHTHPAVLEAAVVGAPEPVLGEVPVAYVTLLPGAAATAEELVDHCRGSLARVKVPVSVRVTESLPKNPVGKIDKPRLRSFTVSP
ncbi:MULTISPECIES: AMP-binding protein [Streptomyces]|uniref:Acyl-CoA synthetase n=1 Tax=Streptomyces bottropensis ATCC 25435 TaxID=1054862 RepID=M3E9Q6_9ACTN|nr:MULTISPECIES: AMP-binding protein [Streptomyces]EMF52901.1 acyl-CoA synthetase [Streptomyces bottropensis ATCC 25435]MZD21963.1 AMP-binding protein [Streptomyces sp. SID5476]